MENNFSALQDKSTRAYICLVTLVICGLAGSLITGGKVVHVGINFPFSNIVFSIFTYPIVDCICELWGKRAARQAILFGLSSQVLLTFIIQISIITPHAAFWLNQDAYRTVLGTGFTIVVASLLAFTVSQVLDIMIYQRIKEWSNGKLLWLRSNISTYLGQIIDSSIFVSIVFYDSKQKLTILFGSILVKVFLSLLMTPFVYLIVISIHRYLGTETLAFKGNRLFQDIPNGAHHSHITLN